VQPFNPLVGSCTVIASISEISHNKLKKFKIDKGKHLIRGAKIHYNPTDAPQDADEFEANLLRFLVEHSKGLKEISIGSTAWIEQNFTLSTKFCKSVVEELTDIKRLELFNVSNLAEVVPILMKSTSLRRTKLHQSKDGEKIYPCFVEIVYH
jgi:hypothetical protein